MARSPFFSPPKPITTQVERIQVLSILACALCILLLIRLFDLQIMTYKHFRTLSFKNQMSYIPTPPPRGIIVDKNDVVLADNMPVYVLELTPEHIKDLPHTLSELQKLIPSISEEDMRMFNKLKRQNRAFMPLPLKMKLTQEEIAAFAVNQHLFPGVEIKAESMRYYPNGEETAHLLGYVGRINLEELKKLDPKAYQGERFIGKTGIERFYETLLHGQNGHEKVETDVSGRVVRVINKKPPTAGAKLKLTIDAKLQHAAYEALGDEQGAVVIIETKTGRLLSLVSKPSFDANLFVGGISAKNYNELANRSDRPLFNRAVRGLYPPASTIKPFVALTALNLGVVDEDTTIYDPGWYRLPNASHIYHDWNRQGHGMVDVFRALTVSCDTYFYHLGKLLGIAPIHHMLTAFGFGALSEVDLIEEAPGLVPSAEWKKRSRGVTWYPGDNLITAIGQGFMLSSPLQLASATATLAENGRRYKPHLLDETTPEGQAPQPYQTELKTRIKLNDSVFWEMIHDGMHAVTTSREGTGRRFGIKPPYPVAAKTGTAQVFGGKEYQRRLHQDLPKHLKDHTLFIAFTPIHQPKIAIAVVVEHDNSAATVARKVLDAYYELYPLENKA